MTHSSNCWHCIPKRLSAPATLAAPRHPAVAVMLDKVAGSLCFAPIIVGMWCMLFSVAMSSVSSCHVQSVDTMQGLQ